MIPVETKSPPIFKEQVFLCIGSLFCEKCNSELIFCRWTLIVDVVDLFDTIGIQKLKYIEKRTSTETMTIENNNSIDTMGDTKCITANDCTLKKRLLCLRFSNANDNKLPHEGDDGCEQLDSIDKALCDNSRCQEQYIHKIHQSTILKQMHSYIRMHTVLVLGIQ